MTTRLAVQEENADWWKFIINEMHVLPTSGKVVVMASDLPENEAIKEADI